LNEIDDLLPNQEFREWQIGGEIYDPDLWREFSITISARK
jgi:hypothetical protein